MSYTSQHEKAPVNTPWGKPDVWSNVAEGIATYSTPSHGGYWLSRERMLQMPANLRQCSFTRDNWFEEDCSWCAVVLAFPQYFEDAHYKAAKRTYDNHYAPKYGKLAA